MILVQVHKFKFGEFREFKELGEFREFVVREIKFDEGFTAEHESEVSRRKATA